MSTRTRTLLLLLILLIAALLRARGLLYIEHNVDQAYPIGQALNTLDRGLFPIVGQGTSVLFANPALTGYLYAPLIALTRTPLAAYLLVISLNTLGVWCGYRGTRLLFGEGTALIAAWLLAVNPWVIEYSRNTWVQSLLPLFAPLLFWLLAGVLLGRSRRPARRRPARRLFAACITLTLAAQTYLLAYLLLVPCGLLVGGYWRRVRAIPGGRRALAAGMAIFGLVTAFYLAGVVSARDSGARIASFAGTPAHLSSEAASHALRLVTGGDYALARGTEAPENDAALRQSWGEVAHLLLAAALIGGMARAAYQAVRGGDHARRAGRMALLWLCAPALLMSYVGQVVHPFYLLLTLPAGAALAGFGLMWPLARLTQAGQAVPGLRARVRVGYGLGMAGLLLAFGLLMAIDSARFAEATAATPGAHDLGALPLGDGLRLGDTLRAQADAGIVFADVDRWTLESLSARSFSSFLRESRAGQTPGFRILPREGGLYVQALPADGADAPLPEGATRTSLRLADGTALTVDRLPAAAAPSASPLARGVRQDQPDVPILTLERATLTSAGATVTLTSEWGVVADGAAVAGTQYAPFAQVFDAETGASLGVYEGQRVPGEEWRTGDRHLHTIVFPRPAQAYRVRVGQYDSAAGQNLILILPDGRYEPVIGIE